MIIKNKRFKISKKRQQILITSFSLILAIIISFFVNSPVVQLQKFSIKDFGIINEDNTYESGVPLLFNWLLAGGPEKVIVIFGDGEIKEVSDLTVNNKGIMSGSIKHIYSLQGRYNPIIQIWNRFGAFLTKSFEITIRNEQPLFNFAIGSVGSESYASSLEISGPPSVKVFEDEIVKISVNTSDLLDDLSFIYDFGDLQTITSENVTYHQWKNQGTYPVSITVLGSQGELRKEMMNVDVINRNPTAYFSIESSYPYELGTPISFNANRCNDTTSDIASLRYLWSFGDGTLDYGKKVSHTYSKAGSYNITLTVKDNDGMTATYSRVIGIESTIPQIELEEFSASQTFSEGDPVLFKARGSDDSQDIIDLIYYWNFDGKEFDLENLDSYTQGGRLNLHYFDDDYDGNISAALFDSDENHAVDSTSIQVKNIPPELRFYNAYFQANISFLVMRDNIESSLNRSFLLQLQGDNTTMFHKELAFADNSSTTIATGVIPFPFLADRDYNVVVNSTCDIFDDTEYEIRVNITFSDAKVYSLSSGLFAPENEWSWVQNLNSLFYSESNYGFNHPLSLSMQVFDPSIDEIDLSIMQSETKEFIISAIGTFPQDTSYIIEGISYDVHLYEQEGQQIASIYAETLIENSYLVNNTFPVNKDLVTNLNELVDLNDILENVLGLSEVSVLDCLEASIVIEAEVSDDDGGKNTSNLTINVDKGIEFENLQTRILHDIKYDTNPAPFGVMSSFLPTAYEGEKVKFTSKVNDGCCDLQYKWDFSDGYTLTTSHAEHAWQNAGVYNITLTIADAYGNMYRDIKNITILKKAPEIKGPFAFETTEGTALVLDIEVYDSERDESTLHYAWYDEKGILFSNEAKPKVILDNGRYEYTLVVTDATGESSSETITINVHSLAPKVFIGNYMYHGVQSEKKFTSDGEIELRAWGLDTSTDMDFLEFFWEIRKGKDKYVEFDNRGNYYSDIIFTCKETGIYQGKVTVIDPEGKKFTQSFTINCVIDAELNGISDNVEDMLRLAGNSTTDTDGDGLTDTYEQTISNTSYLDPDTDGDGLWDGYTINSTLGELSFETDNLDYDSDDDLLADGNELFGWNVSVVYFENSSNFHVTSDPLDNNSDSDGLSDYEEFLAGTHPQLADTDNDLLNDDVDPFPTKWDGDEDSLSDYWEIEYGTDPNNTDTDQDGLKDGEEVYSWGLGFFTNPLDADTDHDFVSDSAEIKNYLVKLADENFDDLDKKVNLSSPVTLHFPQHFTQASAAQISFGISFGEHGTNATGSYGVPEEDVIDLNVIITKKDTGLILANFSTNNTRYFSQVVDITEFMHNESLDFYGDYEIGIATAGTTISEGHYPATYSFESVSIGEDPEGWTDASTAPSYAEVVEEVDEHKMVVEACNPSSTYISFYNDFDPQTSGTVEFWLRKSSTHSSCAKVALQASGTNAMDFRIDWYNNGKFEYGSGGWQNTGYSYQDDKWMHIRIDFDSNSDKYDLWIDGTQYLDDQAYQTATGGLTRLYFYSYAASNPTKYWIDAVGFSWDQDYFVGDNEEEAVYNYAFHESGNYPGTYSFDEDDAGENPGGWNVLEGYNMDIQVEDEVEGHKKVLSVNDWYSSGSCYAEQSLSSGQSSGTVEWWFSAEGTSSNRIQDVRFGWSSLADIYTAFRIVFSNNYAYVQHGSGSTTVLTFSADTWYHLKISWDSTSGGYDDNGQDQFTIYVDGIDKGTFDFWHNHDTIDKLRCQSWGTSCRTNEKIYYDAFGFSWNDDYNIGDNEFDGNAKCYLEYFELDFSRYLDPNDPDSDDDGILDGVEMGVLVNGTDLIQVHDYYLQTVLNTTQEIEILNQWNFEEGSGTTVYDSSGSINGTNYGASYSDGKQGKYSLEFDGSNDYVNIPHDDSIGTLDAWTLSAWIMRDEMGVQHSIIEKYDWTASKGQFALRVASNNKVYVYHISGTSYTTAVSTTTIEDEKWYFVVGSYDTTENKVRVYINGELEDETSSTLADYSSSLPLRIGARGNDLGTKFDGKIDNVCIYGERLTSEEIKSLFFDELKVLNLTLNTVGNYTGTYSFEDHPDGTNGTDIDFIDSLSVDSNCDASIISEFAYHNKVLELSDDNSGGEVYAYNTAFERDNGTIEFWWAQTDASKQSILKLYDGSTTALSLYMRDNGKFSWYDGSFHDIGEYDADTWYHHKIIFNCSAGTKGKFDWYINGVMEVSNQDFWGSCEQLDTLLLGTDTSSSGFDAYFDAIGYCWYMPNISYYWEGENIEEPMPDTSNIGDYVATYSFTDEAVGTTGTNIDFIDYDSSSGGCWAKIIESCHGHNKVIQCYDGSMYGKNEIRHYFDTSQSSGSIEFWMRTNYPSKGNTIYLYGSSGYLLYFGFNDGYFRNNIDSIICPMSANTWYHIRIDFECTPNEYEGLSQYKYQMYINDVHYGEYSFCTNLNSVSHMVFHNGWTSDAYYYIYYDSFGFSWAPDYEMGLNRYPYFPTIEYSDEYFIEIPQIGQVTDAQLDLKIESIGTTSGSGQLFVQLIKDNLNYTLEDIPLIRDWVTFDPLEQFSYSESVDLSSYIADDTVYGAYVLQIELFGTKESDLFNLTTFSIETDTFIPADFENTVGWVTDPADEDTDGDGWTDYYEIFTSGTSPLSKDSDGDEANDPQDRDPLSDVMLEIHPYRGDYNNLGWLDSHALMQIVVAFSFGDNDYYIITPVLQATSNPNIFGSYQRGYFDEHYYINIDDDTTRQGNTITMNFQLYSVYRHLGANDIKGIDEDVQYTINTNGEYTTLDANDIGTYNYYNYMYVKVKTVFIEKANTLAIYEANSTFNGHYNDPNQRYSIIQLNIPGEEHYLGSESFINEAIGSNSTQIEFVTSDSSSVESYVKIYEEIEGHSQVLGVKEGASDHSDFYHQILNQNMATIEWWWCSSKASGGILSMDFRYGSTDAIRLYIRDGKIKYHDGNYHDVMSVSSDTWYRMKLSFVGDIPGYYPELEYKFDLYVDEVLKVEGGDFASNQANINRIGISTSGDPFTGYFDAFGYSWDSDYATGDNADHYDCSGTPFQYGMNVIVIPTELFTQTLLNGYVENGNLSETVLYHENSTIFEFTGPDRDGSSSKANADVDFVFIRHQISPEDALEVLDLVLYGITNETMDENNQTLIHSYVSTKLNGTKATHMNLPYSVLGYIPWVNNYTNSAMGDEPDPSGAFDLLLWAMCLVNPLLRVVLNAQMAMTGGAFFAYLKDFLATIFMQALAFLAQLVWVIVRAALLVLMYIVLALEILVHTITHLTIGVSMLALTMILGGYSNFSWDFVEFSIEDPHSDRNRIVRMESSISWVYWEFFDMEFPWLAQEILLNGQKYMTMNNSVINQNTLNEFANAEPELEDFQGAPTLHCDYEIVSGTTYRFWTTYDDASTGADAPDQYYGVRLHLIAPNGTALPYYEMDVADEYLPNPDYSSPVEYTYTIDLSTLYYGFEENEDGLWHYYFSTKDSSDEHPDPIIYPENGYLLGPDLSIARGQGFFDYRVSSDLEHDYNPVGFIDDNFVFAVLWGCSEAPQCVNLCLIPANKYIGDGISFGYGIKKFEMETVEQNPNYNDLVEYNYEINFSSLGYESNEIGQFSHYYEGVFSDGSKTYLYLSELIQEADEDDDESYTETIIYKDFLEPYVAIDQPQFTDYNFIDLNPAANLMLNNFKDAPRKTNYFMLTETLNNLQFEVIFLNSDGERLITPPKLVFENLVTGQRIEKLMDLNFKTPLSDKYGENAFSYQVCLNNFYLPSGMWTFKFEGVDNNGLTIKILESEKRIWHIGSGVSMLEGLSIGANIVGNIPWVGFITSISTQISNPGISTALSLASLLLGLGFSGFYLSQFFMSKNTGAILGLSVAMLLTSFSFAAASKGASSQFLRGGFDAFLDLGDKLTIWMQYLSYILLLESFLGMIPFQFGVLDLSFIYDIIYYPLEIISLFVFSMVAGILNNFIACGHELFAGVSTSPATKIVQLCLKVYAIIALVISMTGFAMFYFESQAYGNLEI